MFEYEEVIALALGAFVVLFLAIRAEDVRRLASSNWLIGAFFAMFAGSVATVAEGWLPLGGWMNVVEHLGYMAGVGLAVWWIWRHMAREEAGA